MYLGIIGTLAVNRSMLILYGSARLLPERVRSKHDLKPSLADLRPTFQQDWDLCRSSLHVGWPGGPGRSLILKQICSGLLKAPLLQGGVAYMKVHTFRLVFILALICTHPLRKPIFLQVRLGWKIAYINDSISRHLPHQGFFSTYSGFQ